MKHAVMPETWATSDSPTTYGALLTAARERAALAITHTPRLGDPDLVAVELAGYERFLRVAGIHLALLEDLSGVTTTGLEQLRRDLRHIKLREVEPSMWLDAAKSLGAAHDLVSTHTTVAGPRTAEAMDLVVGPASLSSCRDLTAADRGRSPRVPGHDQPIQVAPHGDRAQPRPQSRGCPCPTALNSRIEITDEGDAVGARRSSSATTVAPISMISRSRSPPQPSWSGHHSSNVSSQAIRLLRQLTFLQSQGRVAASPASLRDLAALGARMTDPDLPLPEPRTALDRVRIAHARDRMDTAHTAWNAAGRGTSPMSIRGAEQGSHDASHHDRERCRGTRTAALVAHCHDRGPPTSGRRRRGNHHRDDLDRLPADQAARVRTTPKGVEADPARGGCTPRRTFQGSRSGQRLRHARPARPPATNRAHPCGHH